MAKWAFNNQPRCQQCKRFISRTRPLMLCKGCTNPLADQWLNAIGSAEHIRCSCCKRPYVFTDTGWRFNGETWEHKCPENDSQAGYFTAERIQP